MPRRRRSASWYEAGESGPAIAKVLGAGEHAISSALKRNGVEKRPAVAGDRLDPEIEADVCRRYLAGQMPKRIGEETGIGVSTVNFVLKRNGIEPRYKVRYTTKQVAEAVRRYVAGEATDEIATALGISPGGIYPVLRRNGLDPTRKPPRLEWDDAEVARVVRSLPAYRRWRLAVLRRDGRACQECGAHSSFENPLHVHHLRSFVEILAEYRPISVEQAEGYDALWDVDNGVTLCADCHREAHANVSHLP
jgi:hypothetical protein